MTTAESVTSPRDIRVTPTVARARTPPKGEGLFSVTPETARDVTQRDVTPGVTVTPALEGPASPSREPRTDWEVTVEPDKLPWWKVTVQTSARRYVLSWSSHEQRFAQGHTWREVVGKPNLMTEVERRVRAATQPAETASLIVTAARSVVLELEAGRPVDPSRLAWADAALRAYDRDPGLRARLARAMDPSRARVCCAGCPAELTAEEIERNGSLCDRCRYQALEDSPTQEAA